MSKTKILAINSLLCAMAVATMAISAVFETLDISLAVIAGLLVAVSETEFGSRSAWLVFAVTGILSFLLPQKTAALFFILLAGWYPILQPKINMLKTFFARIIKLGVINAAITVAVLAARFVFMQEMPTWLTVSFIILGNIAFYLYDILLARLVIFYIVKVRNKLGFGK